MIALSLKGTIQNDKELQDRIYWAVISISTGITAVGFFLCVWNYKESNQRRRYILQNEQKQHTFDNIFGFLAGLSITTALIIYYGNFLALIGTELYSGLQTILTGAKLSSDSVFSNWFFVIPNLHLIDFFVIAIPLTHAGYLLLQTLANEKEVTSRENNEEEKKSLTLHLRLVGAFVISIILIGLLFFLGGSIAGSDEIIEPIINQTTGKPVINPATGEVVNRITERPNFGNFYSNSFVFWLNLIVIGMIAWSLTIRKLIEDSTEDQQQPKRIRDEWIWLDVFTFGFLISTALTMFYLQLINDDFRLFCFNLALSVVLVARAILNYYIGRNVYFPKPYQAKTESNTP